MSRRLRNKGISRNLFFVILPNFENVQVHRCYSLTEIDYLPVDCRIYCQTLATLFGENRQVAFYDLCLLKLANDVIFLNHNLMEDDMDFVFHKAFLTATQATRRGRESSALFLSNCRRWWWAQWIDGRCSGSNGCWTVWGQEITTRLLHKPTDPAPRLMTAMAKDIVVALLLLHFFCHFWCMLQCCVQQLHNIVSPHWQQSFFPFLGYWLTLSQKITATSSIHLSSPPPLFH